MNGLHKCRETPFSFEYGGGYIGGQGGCLQASPVLVWAASHRLVTPTSNH